MEERERGSEEKTKTDGGETGWVETSGRQGPNNEGDKRLEAVGQEEK